jgi:hypothetical protein
MTGDGCPACAGVPGAVHSCPDSGTFLAAEAHVAGEVEEIAEAWPTWEATIHLHLKAADEHGAREHLTRLMGDLLDDALVAQLDFALTLHAVTA